MTRIRHPDAFVVGAHSIVDDFCYFSTQVVIGQCSHVASGCTVAGGRERTFRLGDFSSVSAGVRIWCSSDDFVNDLVTIIPPGVEQPKDHLIVGDVTVGSYTAIGSNTVVMPGVTIAEGAVVGALSFVRAGEQLEPWTVYAGTPARALRPRNRENVMRQVDLLRAALDGMHEPTTPTGER